MTRKAPGERAAGHEVCPLLTYRKCCWEACINCFFGGERDFLKGGIFHAENFSWVGKNPG